MGHTPGPLQIEDATEREGEWIYKVVRVADGLRSVVATCYDAAICEEHGGTALANAQLIAAAPDLLAALEHLMKAEPMQRGERNGYVMGTISQAIDMARAALAKAKGHP